MRLKIPLTGTVSEYDPKAAQWDGLGVVGDNNDPVKPININLGNVSWGLIAIDLVNDLAEIEVSPGENINVLKADKIPPGLAEDWTSRPATVEEKQGFLDHAKQAVEGKTKDEHYASTGTKRLVKPPGAVEIYIAKPPKIGIRG